MNCEYKIIYAGDVVNRSHKWVVFLHGFGGSHCMWEKQIELIKSKFNICAVTLPGHGDNTSCIDKKDDAIYTHVAEMILTDLKNMGIHKAYLVSVSMGTIIANKMLLIDNEFVKKSLLIGAVCGTNKFIQFQAQLLSLCMRFLPYKIVVNYFAQLLLPKRAHKKSRHFLVRECLKLDRRESLKWVKALVKTLNYTKNIKLDKKKCVMVVGDEDFVFKNGIKNFSEKCHLKLYVIKKCGHVCSLHKWRDFNFILLDFLGVPNTA